MPSHARICYNSRQRSSRREAPFCSSAGKVEALENLSLTKFEPGAQSHGKIEFTEAEDVVANVSMEAPYGLALDITYYD